MKMMMGLVSARMPLIQLMLFVSNDEEDVSADDEDMAVILVLEFEMNCTERLGGGSSCAL